MDLENHDRPYQDAARWHARLQAMDCSEQERTAFERWRNECPAHACAYAHAEKVNTDFDRMLVADVRLQALAEKAYASGTRKAPARRFASSWTIPASLAAALAVAVIALHFSAPLLNSAIQTAAYDTRDERRTITLDDGSVIQMDLRTRLEVRMGAQRREVALLRGRALFKVAHDSTRPFSVTAAGARTTALGTRFQVERDSGNVLVTLAEGSVAVDDGAAESSWREQLAPGEQLSFDAHDNAIDRRSVDLQHAISWSLGRHSFRGTPLVAAVEEINRYAVKKVRLGDPSLATLPVAGNFITGDSELIVDALAAVLPLRAVAGDGDEILLFRRYE